MFSIINRFFIAFGLLGLLIQEAPAQFIPQTAEESAAAAADYQKYCVLCHGADRQGYVNDQAPSLRSKSLIESGFPTHIMETIGYGRRGTPMGAYSEEMGGPLTEDEIYRLSVWLKDQVGVEMQDLPYGPIAGDIELGKNVFAEHCAVCHGEQGEGDIGPAIGNPAMLSLTTDAFLKYAIENGRDGTEMVSFADTLTIGQINGVTAFLRTRATGWTVEKPVLKAPPPISDWILNPGSAAPEFDLKEGTYVSASDLLKALQDEARMVLLDTRVTSMWQMAHIKGSVPLPYYDNFESIVGNLPTDGTWIVSYCECPRAAAESVTAELRKRDFQNTAVLWEGIQGWVALGFPVSIGQSTAVERNP